MYTFIFLSSLLIIIIVLFLREKMVTKIKNQSDEFYF